MEETGIGEITIEDLFVSYPPPSDPNIQKIIGNKKEFLDVSAHSSSENETTINGLFKRQELAKRVFTAFSEVLMFFPPGSGKTKAFAATAEYYKYIARKLLDSYLTKTEQNPNIKQAIVIVPRNELKKEFYKQIYELSKSDYETEKVLSAKDKYSKFRAIYSEIRNWFTIVTISKFINKIRKRFNYESFYEEYSDCIYFVDEIHSLSTAKIPKRGIDIKSSKRLGLYEIFHVFFHRIKRSKKILSTATPMINSTDDLPPILNLLLPLSQQMPNNFNFVNAKIEDVEPFFRGKVIRVRKLETGIIVEEVGETFDHEYEFNGKKYKSETVVEKCPMSEFQEKIYLDIWNKNARKIINEDLIDNEEDPSKIDEILGKQKSFYLEPKHASNFVFPDGTVGGDFPEDATLNKKIRNLNELEEERAHRASYGLGKYVRKIGPDSYEATPELKKSLGYENIDLIYKHSSKYATIIKNILEKREKAFSYNEFVEGSAAIIQSICFERMGFERFNQGTSAFKFRGNRAVNKLNSQEEELDKNFNMEMSINELENDIYLEDLNKDFINDSDEENEESDLKDIEGFEDGEETITGPILIKPKLRYALITGKTSSNVISNILELWDSKENVHGEYLTALIGSRVTRDGLNFKNTLDVYISAQWHEAGMHQATSRIIRTNAHLDIIKELPPGVKPVVSIHKLDATLSTGEISVDEHMYMLSEIKNRKIKRAEAFLDLCSIDCYINGTKEGECFEPKEFKEENRLNNKIDYSTYDIIYIDDFLKNISRELVLTFLDTNFLTIREVYKRLSIYNRRYINMALYSMIKEKTQLTNRFGYSCTLNINNDIIYLDYDITGGNYEQIFYTTKLVLIEKRTLGSFVYSKTIKNSNLRKDLEIIDYNSKDYEDQVLKKVEQYTIADLVSVLEEILFDMKNNKETWEKTLLHIFRNFIFLVHEPKVDIQRSYKSLMEKEVARGRKRDPNKVRPYGFTLMEPDKESPLMYFHCLYGIELDRVAYSVNSVVSKIFSKIRLLIPSEKLGWRDANNYEVPVYNAVKKDYYEKLMERLEEFNIYGTILTDKKFRIVSKYDESEGAKLDKRKQNKGKIASSWSKNDLKNLLVLLEMVPKEPSPEKDGISYSYEDLKKLDRKTLEDFSNLTKVQYERYDDEQLAIYVFWELYDLDVETYTNLLLEYFKETGKLFII